MPIPPIAPYDLPTPDEVAPNEVAWTVTPERSALLIHDMQQYFLSAYDVERDPARTLLVNIARLRERCHELGIPVIYTMQPGNQHPSRRGILADFWGTGMSHGPDTEVVPELRPHASDIQVTKWRYSAFQRTDLRELLGYYNRDQLMITGVYTHMGCMLSAAEAFMSDVRPFLALDATADFSRDEHLMALNYTARRCGAVLSTADLLEQLSEVPARAG
ncbi:isochorismatase family protein [Nocardia cyriacigeorgica]|uniref:isochorismatase family protein n=1 Tax=Nocardia cyriacigeorgica TaxID=135487 RepID=UPI00189321BD|nr:isochorismatase family protein [Nocardia cyriacigeorgica]MBF6086974.1 isochorismatase family protein [Nocardia cyriacigeorgica]MBF6090703.1 isochorismatase family protein [Nocardia cyriacigeorgica]MBF6322405.1 isochorismatase family protein [Nocardia cyriacigeorgica]MBF6395690.1 isochorismatase family protein [Nocardia cyriacigeorgica]MBF6401322.1 isochorismatase family protein [Nocardia cyriacigeorgica]